MNAVYAILIVQLGSPSFSTRERASEVLAAQYPALPQLVLALKSPDPEVAARAQRLVDRHRTTLADYWIACQGPLPWMDSMPRDFSSWDDLMSHYIGAARLTVADPNHHAGPDFPVYREATRLWLHQQIVSGEDTAGLARVLRMMRERCLRWQKIGQYDEPMEP